ncbi:MAG: hypothetical protein KDH92_00660 [Chloroflexi bacterium]|nr:hypothetical protein [Chloroflexota bacterium]
MRIREICFQDFRSFRGRQVVSFVDPTTGDVRPVSVIVGSDDAAKRTVLEAIDALLSYAIDPRHPRPLVEEAHDAGWIQMGLELTPADLEQFHRMAGALAERPRTRVLRIEVGRRGVAPLSPVQEWSTLLSCLAPGAGEGEYFTNAGALSSQLYTAVARMRRGADLHGGLLYFPGARHHALTGTDPDEVERDWIVRATVAAEAAAALEHSGTSLAGLRLLHEPALAARPGAVIAIEDPAIFELPDRDAEAPALERLREIVREWDAQLIVAAHSAAVLPAFREEERIVLDRRDPAA